jgi:SAM-dependent methyltransferase
MSEGTIEGCGLCGHWDLKLLLDMGSQPLPERDDGRTYPLRLVECKKCTLVQLDYIVGQKALFRPDHPYATGNTRAMREHYAKLANHLYWHSPLGELGVIVDIGANDGTLLTAVRDAIPSVATFGVEPTVQAAKARAAGHIIWRSFFTQVTAGEIALEIGAAKVVTACNVLAHVPNPHDFLRGVSHLLADDGVFVTENHDLLSITEGMQFDTVYHEHLRYYTIATLSQLLAMHGLDVYKTESIPTHGGSFRAWARKRKPDFAIRAAEVSWRLNVLVAEAAEEGTVYGIGAATRATPLVHFTGIANFITVICEVPGSDKIGTCLPGTQVPVVDESALLADQPEYALLLSWHLADTIIPKLRERGYKGKFIVPLPEPKVL